MRTLSSAFILSVIITSTAAAQNMNLGKQISRLNNLFEGMSVEGIKVESFSPGFTIPDVSGAPEIVTVMAEIMVQDAIGTAGHPVKLCRVLNALRKNHGFVADASFTVKRRAEKPFRILPYPPVPVKPVFVVRGFILQAKFAALQNDGSVLKAWVDGEEKVLPESKEAVMKFIQTNGDAIQIVRGVMTVSLGWDCGLEGEHYHITAHRPALVIRLDGTIAKDRVVTDLLAAVPSLSKVLYIFEVSEASAL